MAYLTREQIVGSQGVLTDTVDVPEWGGQVCVREISAALVTNIGVAMIASGQAQETESGATIRVTGATEFARFFPEIVAQCVVDNEHNLKPILTLRDVLRFGAASSEPIQRIAIAAMQLSGLYSEEEVEVGDGEGGIEITLPLDDTDPNA